MAAERAGFAVDGPAGEGARGSLDVGLAVVEIAVVGDQFDYVRAVVDVFVDAFDDFAGRIRVNIFKAPERPLLDGKISRLRSKRRDDLARALDGRTFEPALLNGVAKIYKASACSCTTKGFGDIIQFARFTALLAERGASVVLEVPAKLADLMRSSLAGVAIVGRAEQASEFDFQLPLVSVPYRLNFGRYWTSRTHGSRL